MVFDCENRENFCLTKISTSQKFLAICVVFLFTIFGRTMMRSNYYLIILELCGQVTYPSLPKCQPPTVYVWLTKAEPKIECK